MLHERMSKILMALLGGGLIGLATSLYWLTHGRLAGISSLIGGLALRQTVDKASRSAFLMGLMLAGLAFYLAKPSVFGSGVMPPLWLVGLGGVLVGYGTRLGNGCTSGHGICGVARGARRSIAATATFMATGVVTVAVMRLVGGGS